MAKKILVIGYYNKFNHGDDAYKYVFPLFFPNNSNYEFKFTSTDDINNTPMNEYDAIIVGGGDIINDYFHKIIKDKIKDLKVPKIAVSIGIPFPNLITYEYFGYFDHVFIRNLEDVRKLQKVIGSHRAHFIPDITFLYEKPMIVSASARNISEHKSESKNKKCGIFLVGNMIRYPNFMKYMSYLISKLLLSYDIILYCFDTAEDIKISLECRSKAYENKPKKNLFDKECPPDIKHQITVDTFTYKTQQMLSIMSELDFAVCMKYHAHVFCMILNIPFMSISSSRKTRSLMKQANLSEYQYKIPLVDKYCDPIDNQIFYKNMKDILIKSIYGKNVIKNRSLKFVDKCKFLLSNTQIYNIINYQLNKTNHKYIVVNFLNTYPHNHENAARLLNNTIIGYPDTKFVWGISDKIKNIYDEIEMGIQTMANLESVIDSSINFLKNELNSFNSTALALFDNSLISNIMHYFKKQLPLYVDINEYQTYKDAHRGGWYLACEELYKLNEKNENGIENGIICDMYVDRTFHWARNYLKYIGKIPYTSPWCGFIHHTQNTSYSKYNTKELFRNKDFLQSLYSCVYLFTLSEPLTEYIKRKLLKREMDHVKVLTFTHPIDKPSKLFTMHKFEKNKEKTLVHIGAWLRNPFAIYQIDSPYQKAILHGKNMNDYIPPDNLKIKCYYKIVALNTIDQNNQPSTNNISNPSPSQSPTSSATILPMISQISRTSAFYPSVSSALSSGSSGSSSIVPCRLETGKYPIWIRMFIDYLVSKKIIVVNYDELNKVLYINNPKNTKNAKKLYKRLINTVDIISYKTNRDYDILLSRNIVFLNLVDAAACNTIIECIVRNTPILVNKLTGTIALLGKKYPLFYDDINEIPSLLSIENIENAHLYLKKLDKSIYSIEHFIKNISDINIS